VIFCETEHLKLYLAMSGQQNRLGTPPVIPSGFAGTPVFYNSAPNKMCPGSGFVPVYHSYPPQVPTTSSGRAVLGPPPPGPVPGPPTAFPMMGPSPRMDYNLLPFTFPRPPAGNLCFPDGKDVRPKSRLFIPDLSEQVEATGRAVQYGGDLVLGHAAAKAARNGITLEVPGRSNSPSLSMQGSVSGRGGPQYMTDHGESGNFALKTNTNISGSLFPERCNSQGVQGLSGFPASSGKVSWVSAAAGMSRAVVKRGPLNGNDFSHAHAPPKSWDLRVHDVPTVHKSGKRDADNDEPVGVRLYPLAMCSGLYKERLR
jgi:hypothetical protein